MSKGTIPAGAEFNQAQDEHFERSSIQSLTDSRYAMPVPVLALLPARARAEEGLNSQALTH
jgi:hypothetical protein